MSASFSTDSSASKLAQNRIRCQSQVSARMVCDCWEDCLGGVTWEVIAFKIDLVETSLLCDELNKKVYVPFLSGFRVHEPRFIGTEMKFSDGINSGSKEAFKNKLTDVLVYIIISTESMQIKNFDSRIVVEDLPE